MKLKLSDLQSISSSLGLELVSYISRDELEAVLAEESKRLASWQEEGHAAEMGFMNRPVELFSGLDSIMPETKSIACFAVSYANTEPPPLKPLHGKVARYAWGKDYHLVLRERLKLLVSKLSPDVKTRVFTDAVPILERALGAACELGFVGKNTMLIRPGMGSYFFIAEVLFDCEIEQDKPKLQVVSEQAGCKTCTSCLDSCPTDAFTDAFNLDSGKCISYLTIEKRGCFTENEITKLGDWVFGCDVCQDVCPFNHQGTKSAEYFEEFSRESGVGPSLSLRELLKIKTDAEFKKRFKGTALLRAGREGMLRNAAAVIANQNALALTRDLVEASKTEQSENLRYSYKQALKALSQGADGADLKLLKAVGA